MYNAEQKQSFLNTIDKDNSYKSYRTAFNRTEKFEERFDKDVSDMSVEELKTLIDICGGTRFSGTNMFISLLKTYVDWCIQTGKTTSENNFDKIDRNDVNKTRIYLVRYLKDKTELEEMINVVFAHDFDYNEDVDIQRELVVRLAYEGLHEQEVCVLKKQDVDFENKIIHSPVYPDIFYIVDDKILEMINFCINQETIHRVTKNGVEKVEKLCQNDYVLRKRSGAIRESASEETPNTRPVVVKIINQFCVKYNDLTDSYKDLSFAKMRESRIFHDIYNSGNEEAYIMNEIKTDIAVRNPDIKVRALNDRLNELRKNYYTWKEAFYSK